MLTRFGPGSGGTHLLPGSHQLPDNPAAGRMRGFPPSTYEDLIEGEVQPAGLRARHSTSRSEKGDRLAQKMPVGPELAHALL